MAGAFGFSDALPVLKEHYRGQVVADLTFKNRPAFGLMPKRTGVGGKTYPLPIKIANLAGASNRFADAVGARQGSVYDQWAMTHVESYATATIDHKTSRLLAGDRNGFIELVTSEIDSSFETFANDTQFSLFSDGSGVRGVVTGAPAGAVITLANEDQTRNFYVGMQLDVAATVGGAVTGEQPRVVAVDPNGPTITVSAIGTIADTNFLFRRGDAADAGANVKNEGFASWMPDPATITGGDDHFGIDRSVEKRRLLGQFRDATGDTVEQTLVEFAATIMKQGEGQPDVAIINPTTHAVLAQEVEQRGRYDKVSSTDARVFYSSLKIMTGAGEIDVIADPWCPAGEGYLLQLNTWELFSTDPLPTFISEDGARLHRLEAANEHEFRIGGYFNLACVAPGKNGRVIDLPVTLP